jgi:hypothetical protein
MPVYRLLHRFASTYLRVLPEFSHYYISFGYVLERRSLLPIDYISFGYVLGLTCSLVQFGSCSVFL